MTHELREMQSLFRMISDVDEVTCTCGQCRKEKFRFGPDGPKVGDDVIYTEKYWKSAKNKERREESGLERGQLRGKILEVVSDFSLVVVQWEDKSADVFLNEIEDLEFVPSPEKLLTVSDLKKESIPHPPSSLDKMVVILFIAYNGVEHPDFWKRWWELLDDNQRRNMVFVVHAPSEKVPFSIGYPKTAPWQHISDLAEGHYNPNTMWCTSSLVKVQFDCYRAILQEYGWYDKGLIYLVSGTDLPIVPAYECFKPENSLACVEADRGTAEGNIQWAMFTFEDAEKLYKGLMDKDFSDGDQSLFDLQQRKEGTRLMKWWKELKQGKTLEGSMTCPDNKYVAETIQSLADCATDKGSRYQLAPQTEIARDCTLGAKEAADGDSRKQKAYDWARNFVTKNTGQYNNCTTYDPRFIDSVTSPGEFRSCTDVVDLNSMAPPLYARCITNLNTMLLLFSERQLYHWDNSFFFRKVMKEAKVMASPVALAVTDPKINGKIQDFTYNYSFPDLFSALETWGKENGEDIIGQTEVIGTRPGIVGGGAGQMLANYDKERRLFDKIRKGEIRTTDLEYLLVAAMTLQYFRKKGSWLAASKSPLRAHPHRTAHINPYGDQGLRLIPANVKYAVGDVWFLNFIENAINQYLISLVAAVPELGGVKPIFEIVKPVLAYRQDGVAKLVEDPIRDPRDTVLRSNYRMREAFTIRLAPYTKKLTEQFGQDAEKEFLSRSQGNE